jgi:thioredoxin reductase (NADPH)
MILNPEKYRGQKVVIAGGGDSALDWTMFLADVASELTLVHRSKIFRGAPDSVSKVMAMAESGKIKLHLNANLKELKGNGQLSTVTITEIEGGEHHHIDTDHLIPLFGLSPKLGPIEHWGLNLDKNAIHVNVVDYGTNVPGIYAIGDINTYPGKLKLILCGYHEAALMVHGAHKYLHPDQKITLKYTTVNGVNAF